MDRINLNELVEELVRAKKAESKATEYRRIIEDQILAVAHSDKAEGSTTLEAGRWKVTIQNKLSRTIDSDQLVRLQDQIPSPILNRVVRYKPSLDVREWKYIENNEPQYAAILSAAITTKPAKPYLKVSRMEETV